jgi:O-antigen/teichoic acid export membrane protein
VGRLFTGWGEFVDEKQVGRKIEHQAAQSGGILLFRHGLAFAANFLGGIFLNRWLGPEKMGLYFTVFTYFIIGRQVIDFSLSTFLIQSAEEPDRQKLSSCFWFQNLIALLILAVGFSMIFLGFPEWVVGPAAAKEFSLLLAGAALGLLVYSWQSLSVAVLERKMAYSKVGLVEVLDPLIFNLLAVGLVWKGFGIFSLALALAVRGILPALAAAWVSGFRPAWEVDLLWLRTSLRRVSPLIASQAVNWGTLLAPSILLVKEAGASEFAFANMAYSLLGSMGFLVGIFQRISFASFSRLQGEPDRLNRMAERLLNLLTMVYVPIFFGLGAWAPVWVPEVYGEAWRPMASVMVWAALPTILTGLFSVFYSSVLAGGLNRLVFFQNLANGVIFWVALALLTPVAGPLAWPLSHLAAVPCALIYVRAHIRKYGFFNWKTTVFNLGAGILWTAGSEWLLNHHFLGAALVWSVVFLGVWIPWMWTRNGITIILRKVLTGSREDAILP